MYLLILAVIFLCCGQLASAVEVSRDGLTLSVERDGAFAWTDRETGWGLRRGRLFLQRGSAAPVPLEIREISTGGQSALVLDGRAGESRFTVDLRLAEQARLTVEATELPREAVLLLRGELGWGGEPWPCRLEPGDAGDVCQLATGPTASLRLNALFDVQSDRAFMVESEQHVLEPMDRQDPSAGFTMECVGQDRFRLTVREDVYRAGRGIRYYEPLDRRFFKRPPCGWLSWYHYGWSRITEEEMHRNTDWMAEHLKPFGAEYILLDAGFSPAVWREWSHERFPSGGRAMADYIKSRGMKPALWLTPFSTSDDQLPAEHPDWFLRDAEGGTVKTFIGKHTIDATNPEVLEQWLEPLFRSFNEWGYLYYKLDGQTTVADAYREHSARFFAGREPGEEVAPMDAYRRGLGAIRRVVGPERFLISCWGITPEGIGITNGSRTSGDVNTRWDGFRPALEGTRRWLFLNNICWITDPDCALVAEPLTLDQARVWASMVALTGQHLMVSDKMYDLPEERVEILRRIFPVCFMKPLDLYPLTARQVRTIDLRVEKPFGRWDVLGLFHWWRNEAGAMAEIRPERLGLPGSADDVCVGFDFWENEFIPPFSGALRLRMRPSSCRVVALHALEERPQMLSTSRHVTQGAMDLLALAWDGNARTLSGRSAVVADDAYQLRMTAPPAPAAWRAVSATAVGVDGGPVSTELEQNGPWVRLTLRTNVSGEVDWSVTFGQESHSAPDLGTVEGLSAVALSHREVWVRWQGAGPDALTFRVRRADGSEFNVAGTEFIDTDLGPDRTYTYEVAPVGWSGTEGQSAEASVSTLPAPSDPPEPDVHISDLKAVEARVGWGNEPRKDASIEGNPLRIAGREYARGMGVHARSELIYELKPEYRRFVAVAGIDDEVENNPRASVVFSVEADGRLLRETDVVRAGRRVVFDLPIPPGAERLRLCVDDARDGLWYDHADWARAGFVVE